MFSFNALLLTAAASQAKKDALAKKYKLESPVVEQLSNIDPTPNGEFTDWLCREASRTHLPKLDQLDEITGYLNEYIKLKRNPEWKGERNILNLDFSNFKTTMETASREDYSKKQKVRDIEENAKKYITEGVKYLGMTEGCFCYQVLTPQASAAMSKGTHWCTQNEGTSRNYLEHGKIYVFTKDGYVNDYDNDKYAQIYVSSNRIEGETSDGRDITSNHTWGVVYTHEAFKFLQFLSQFNELLKEGFEAGRIVERDDQLSVCSDCGDEVDVDDAFTVGDDIYCQNCYFDHFDQCVVCGHEIDLENDTYHNVGDGRACDDCAEWCPDCEEAYITSGRRAVTFYTITDARGDSDKSVCENCFDNNGNYYTCFSCNDNFERPYKDLDGDEYCPECYAEKWDESTFETLEKWLDDAGLTDTVRREVTGLAEKRFKGRKEALVGSKFKEMQDNGYLYSWDDLNLETAIQFVPEGANVELDSLRQMVEKPISVLLEKLAAEMRESDDPDQEWDEDDVKEWLESNDVIDSMSGKYHNNLAQVAGM